MENLPEAIQNKIMYLTLSHPIAEMMKNTEWFYTLKRRAEQPFYSEQEIKEILDDEFDEFDEIVEIDENVKGKCFECDDKLNSEEFNRCSYCFFLHLKCCKKCGSYKGITKLCLKCK